MRNTNIGTLTQVIMASCANVSHRRRRLLRHGAGIVLLLAVGGLAGCGNLVSSPLNMVVHRDPGCGCCEQWAQQMGATGRFTVSTVDDADIAHFKRSHSVPADLTSCHTALVGDYVLEGHVPAEDIARLLAERPAGIIGLAVPGMPIGSPGMESPGGARDAFNVYAFTADGDRTIFAHHAG